MDTESRLKRSLRKVATANATVAAPTAKPSRRPICGETVTLADLMARELPEPQFLIGGLLPIGLSVLAGRPKSGKSWLALLWAIALSEGATVGAFDSRKVPVLYLALEDTPHRLKKRAGKVLTAGYRASANLDIRVACPRAGDGGLTLVAEWFRDHPGGLVVVDTLAKFRDRAGSGSAYEDDYKAVADLKSLADAAGGAVLLIHHTRKGGADDPFDEVSGTLGITGAADSTFVLERNRGESGASLYVTGRDIAEQTFALTWDVGACVWSIAAPADGIARVEKPKLATRVEQCAKWLREFIGGYSWPDAEIIEAARGKGFNEDNVKRAKAGMRREEPPLCCKARGSGGAWWNWIGERHTAKPDRPHSAAVGISPQTPQTPQTEVPGDTSNAPGAPSHTLFMHEYQQSGGADQSGESVESVEGKHMGGAEP